MAALLVDWMVVMMVEWEAKKAVVLVDLMVSVSDESLAALMVEYLVSW